jgi:hypothetical protein
MMDSQDKTTVFQICLIIAGLIIFGPIVLAIFQFAFFIVVAVVIVIAAMWLFGLFDDDKPDSNGRRK